MNSLKKKLEGAKGKWVDELLSVLWAYQTTSRKPTRTRPFTLTYGMKAIISTKVRVPIARTVVREARNGRNDLQRHLDWADEEREVVVIQIASYQ